MSLTDDFIARFPELDAIKAADIIPTLTTVWPCYYGGDYAQECDQEAILNLLAHLFLSETKASTGSTKGVASKSVRGLSVSYVAASGGSGEEHDFYASSKYGQRFLMLTRTNSGGVFV
jgi:hypothetical protein